MASPLRPVLANIFMVELEEYLMPKLQDKVDFWRRYVDDTQILKENCCGYKRRKLSESWFIRDKKPVLNLQDQSIPLT